MYDTPVRSDESTMVFRTTVYFLVTSTVLHKVLAVVNVNFNCQEFMIWHN